MDQFDYQKLEDYYLEQNDQVSNLDQDYLRTYNYFLEKGFTCIVLNRVFNLLTGAWAIFLTIFLASCVDWNHLFSTYDFDSSIEYQGLPPALVIFLFPAFLFWFFQFFYSIWEIKENWQMKKFYNHKLGISEINLQTIEWFEVVEKVLKLTSSSSPQKHQLNALEIANIIMRKENYLVCMINKDIIDLRIPFPFLNFPIYTTTLEYSLKYIIFNFVFPNDSFNIEFLDISKMNEKSKELRRRFLFVGIISLILSPFFFIFLLIYALFKYGEVLRNQPHIFTSRQWTPLAKLKFRELNELHHIFQKRLNSSIAPAGNYVNCFPVNWIAIFARFLSFIIGSIVFIFLVIGLINNTAVSTIYIGRFNLVYYTVIGTGVLAVLRSLVPDSNAVLEPKKAMEEIVQHTHYMVHNKAHTYEAFKEFSTLFQPKLSILLFELFSVLLAPFILIFSASKCSERIIDFFRQFTICVPKIGYVCKFSQFPIEEHGSKQYGSSFNTSKGIQLDQGKLEKSLLSFKANYPQWQPPSKDGEQYLLQMSRIVDSGNKKENLSTQSEPKLSDSMTQLEEINKHFFNSEQEKLFDRGFKDN